jgi:uncharacterized protein
MRYYLLFTVILIFNFCSQTQVEEINYLESIQQHRQEIDHEFKNSETSPLPNDSAIDAFTGLQYFEIDSSYLVKAFAERIKGAKPFTMATTKGEKDQYLKYYLLHFKLKGKPVELTAYQSLDLINAEKYKDYMFVPFKDATNGESTYSGGRFLEFDKTGKDSVIIDFNLAYNPYCAYNIKYSCPIPPAENHLDIAIEAGEKDFGHGH